ncbi:MAG TPA: ABC transporter permease [Bryobacteraceae bacterium]
MNTIWQDIRYGIRMLASKPGFTAAAVLVLALGIGANSAVFSLVNAFLFKPLPVERPAELMGLYSRDTKHLGSYRAFSYPNYTDIRASNPVFSSLAAMNMAMVGVQEGETTRRSFAAIVSSNYFSTLGVAFQLGRPFEVADESAGRPLTAVVTYSYWKKHGFDPQLIGKQIRVNSRQFEVVGITPEGFTGTTAVASPELFLPLGAYGLVMNDFEGQGKPLGARDNHNLIVFGRMKAGVTKPSANAMLAVIGSQLEKAYPAENKDQTLVVEPLSRMGISTSPRTDASLELPAIMLLSLASVVLLIACFNLANMMMAQGSARRREIGIRLAMGGSRGRIIRQLFTEGLLLATLGGAAGLMLASWSTTLLIKSLVQLAPIDVVYEARPDVRVIGFTLFFCTLATIVFALFPALNLSKPDVWGDIKDKSGTGEASGRPRRLFSRGNVLVMAQLSLSLMMLAAAGLFVRSAARAADVQPGFSLDNEIVAEVDASLANIDQAHSTQIYHTLEDRLRQIPGVQSVAIAATIPFGMMQLGKNITPSGVVPSKEHPAVEARYNIVGADYFATLGIPALRGRAFTTAETAAGSKANVAIIDKLAAEKLWPGADPIGERLRVDSRATPAPPELEVVGVVGNIRENILGDGVSAHLYTPFGQDFQTDIQIHLKVAPSAAGSTAETQLLEAIRRQVRATDERIPLLELRTMHAHLESSFDLWIVRTGAHMLEIFGSVALLLAMIGLYALNAYTVARRTREIGIRMALGADASATLKMILREALKVTAAGVGVGLALAIGIGQLLAGFLYDVRGFDPVVLTSAPILLGIVALLACYVPARRAARVDPMIALRYE